jgi:hypothetical protein
MQLSKPRSSPSLGHSQGRYLQSLHGEHMQCQVQVRRKNRPPPNVPTVVIAVTEKYRALMYLLHGQDVSSSMYEAGCKKQLDKQCSRMQQVLKQNVIGAAALLRARGWQSCVPAVIASNMVWSKQQADVGC